MKLQHIKLFSISFLYAMILSFLSCNNTPQTDPNDHQKTPSTTSELTKFLATPAKIESVLHGMINVLTFDSKMTNHYNRTFPPAAVLFDYDSSGHGWQPFVFTIANIPQIFEVNLPQAVKDALQSHNLLGKGLVDIRFVAQWNTTLGEEVDHGGIPTTTHIAAHAWLDPDAPANYSETRVNRQFLQGIYGPKKDISTAKLPLNQLITTEFHIHDNLFSPRAETNLIRLGKNDASEAFWIVIIDHQNPNGQMKALANLIWVVDQNQWNKLLDLAFDKSRTPLVNSFGDLFFKLNNSPDFQGWHGLNLLNDLLK